MLQTKDNEAWNWDLNRRSFFFKLSVEHMHECTAEKSSSMSEGLVWRLEISSQALRAQSVWTEENSPCWNTVLTEPQYWAAKYVESPTGRQERWQQKKGTMYVCYVCISTCMHVHTKNVKTSMCNAHCLSRWEDTELNKEDSTPLWS